MARVNFSQVLAELNVHLDDAPNAPPPSSPVMAPDSLELSIQGQNALPGPRASSQTSRASPQGGHETPQVDAQGNQTRISSSGAALSRPDEVAWETGRTPRREAES